MLMSLSSFFNYFRDYQDYAYSPNLSAVDPVIRNRFLQGYQEEYLGLTKDTASFSKPLETYFTAQNEQFRKALEKTDRELTEENNAELEKFKAREARIKREIVLFEEEFAKVGATVHPGDLAERAKDEKSELLAKLDTLQKNREDFLVSLGIVLTPATATITGGTTAGKDKDDVEATITGGDDKKEANAKDEGFHQTSKDAREALEKSLDESITTLHEAAELEQRMLSLAIVLIKNKRRFQYEQTSGLSRFVSKLNPPTDPTLPDLAEEPIVSSTSDLDTQVTFTGNDQYFIKQLHEAFRGKDADAINHINGGLASMSGRSIKATKVENGLAFGMNFPRFGSHPYSDSKYYTSEQHNTKADLLCMAELVRATGSKTIEINLNHRNPDIAKQLARQAYAACQEAGFSPIDNSEEGKKKPQEITIILNGQPVPLEDLASMTVGQESDGRTQRTQKKVGLSEGDALATRAKRKRDEFETPNAEVQAGLKQRLNDIKANDPELNPDGENRPPNIPTQVI
jgi:hypothetical protein